MNKTTIRMLFERSTKGFHCYKQDTSDGSPTVILNTIYIAKTAAPDQPLALNVTIEETL